jgi:UDP-N-acetyl-D-glucosamine dehydrogenase
VSSKTVAIIGQGYVGLPLAMAATSSGWKVIGIDVNKKTVASLNLGKSHIEDISDQSLQKAISANVYKSSEDFTNVKNADVVVICVPTPLNDKREPDLAFLNGAVTAVAPHLKNDVLLISESTSYPGTVRDVVKGIISTLREDKGAGILLASAPERVDPGNKKYNHKNTPRLISGLTPEATKKAAEFYRSFTETVIEVSSPEVAETAKLLENTFRQVNIALVNEVAIISRALGIDVREVIEAANSKPYGFMKFTPGAGVGGHCIPVDPSYFSWRAKQVGAQARFIDLANEVNDQMPIYVSDRLLKLIGKPATGLNLLICGVAYKPGVGDVRETPADGVAEYLLSLGAKISWHDPLVNSWRGHERAPLAGKYDGAIVVTPQPGMDLAPLVAAKTPIFDCTGAYKNLPLVEQL